MVRPINGATVIQLKSPYPHTLIIGGLFILMGGVVLNQAAGLDSFATIWSLSYLIFSALPAAIGFTLIGIGVTYVIRHLRNPAPDEDET